MPMEPQYPPLYPPPYQQRRSTPVWVWALVGCGCLGVALFIPIMAAILFPVFAQARERARETGCLSNVKAMSVGALMYAQDYDERLPLAHNWMDGIGPYMKDARDYHCPSLTAEPQAFGYAYDAKLNGLGMDKVQRPDATPLIYESMDLSRNASDNVASLPEPPRHLGGNNIGFADGSAKWIKPGAPQAGSGIQ